MLQQKVLQAKKESLPFRDKGDQRESLQAYCPMTSSSCSSSLLLCWTHPFWSIVHFCLLFLPEKEEVGPVSVGHDTLPSQTPFTLTFLEGLGPAGETNLFKDEIGTPCQEEDAQGHLIHDPASIHVRVF